MSSKKDEGIGVIMTQTEKDMFTLKTIIYLCKRAEAGEARCQEEMLEDENAANEKFKSLAVWCVSNFSDTMQRLPKEMEDYMGEELKEDISEIKREIVENKDDINYQLVWGIIKSVPELHKKTRMLLDAISSGGVINTRAELGHGEMIRQSAGVGQGAGIEQGQGRE